MTKTGTILDYQGAASTPVEGREDEAFNPNWEAAQHDEGVGYICPWEDPMAGFPEHARRCARALDDAGMPTHLRSLDPSMQLHMHFEKGGSAAVNLKKQYDDLLGRSFTKVLVEIYQVVPDDALLQRLTTHRFIAPKQLAAINRFRILSCVFERDRISDHAVRAFNTVGQIWVANGKDKMMLHSCGVERVEVVPIPYFDDDPLLQLRGRERQAGPVRFYHIGKWEHRKAHHEMFGAFLMAFKPGDAKLYFKTSTKAPDFGDYPSSPEQSAHAWVEDDRVKANGWTIELVNQNIHLIKRRIPAKQILQLHKLSDVYVSLSRGEGFDMPAYDAKLAGNMLVHTPSGGPQTFAHGNDVAVPMDDSVPTHPFYRWDDARYGDWRMEDAVAALRVARTKVISGWDTSGYDMGVFSAKSVGMMMRANIDRVLEDGRRYLEERKLDAQET